MLVVVRIAQARVTSGENNTGERFSTPFLCLHACMHARAIELQLLDVDRLAKSRQRSAG
jgi:hypothetical protein